MATAILTEQEKNRIRHHCGYLVVNPVSSIQLGVPRASQPQFLVELAMNSIPDTAIGQIRRWIAILDGIEEQMIDANGRLVAKKVGNIDLNENEHSALAAQYNKWAQVLADDLGIPLNAYSERFRGGPGSINSTVSH